MSRQHEPTRTTTAITPAIVALIYLRADQVVSVLPVSRRTLSNWQARRLIKFYKIGKTVLFKRADIEAAIEKFAVAPIGELKVSQTRVKTVATNTITTEPKPPGKRRIECISTPPTSPTPTRQSEALRQ